MTRTITITDTAAAAFGATITGRTYRLLASDGTTVLSTASPPYVGVSDGLIYVEQTATQSDAQTNTAKLAIPSRVTNLAASAAPHPVISWTDAAGETTYDLHRGSPGFTPDIAGGMTLIASPASGASSYTDGGVVADGVTTYAYRLLAKTPFGYTVSNEATCIPLPAPVQYTTDFAPNGNLTAYAPAWVAGPQYTLNPLVASGGVAYLRGNGVDGVLYDPVTPTSADQSITATLNMKTGLAESIALVFRGTGSGGGGTSLSYRVGVAFVTDHYELQLRRTDGAGGTTLLMSATLASLTLDTPYEFYGTVFDANGGVTLNAHVGPVTLSYTDTSASKITAIGQRGLYGNASVNTSATTGLILLDYTAS